MIILDQLKRIRKSLSPIRPLIEIFVYKDHLLHNLREYQKTYPGIKLAPVLKANAYGHGLGLVLKTLMHQPLPFVALDSHFEFLITKAAAPKMKILILGFVRPETIAASRFNSVSFTVVSLDQLAELSGILKKPRRFHLKLDTGMHRQGLLPAQFGRAVELLKANPNFRLEGLCSHFADPDNEAETLRQIANWNGSVKYFKKLFPEIKYTHLSATGGLKFSHKIDANLARLGIGFYGYENRSGLNLRPALEMRSLITGVKTLAAGEKIGYGFSFLAARPMTIATVPVGYFEGADRRLGNKGFFMVGGGLCPLVGKLSMDMATIDITDNKKAAFGGEVVVISALPNDANSVQNMAKICETIPYEILVHLPGHLKRTLV